MKNIILGTKDYIKDCWRDFWFCFWNKVDAIADRRLHKTYCWQKNEAITVKEGSLWHYIEQRKIANKKPHVTEWKYEDYINNKGDFICAVWAALDEVASNGATHQWFAEECATLCRIAKKKGWL